METDIGFGLYAALPLPALVRKIPARTVRQWQWSRARFHKRVIAMTVIAMYYLVMTQPFHNDDVLIPEVVWYLERHLPTWCNILSPNYAIIGRERKITRRYPGAGCYITFCHHLPIRASKVQIQWKTLAQMSFLLAPKRKSYFLYWKLYTCTQYSFSLPDSGNCYFLVFQNACPRWLLLAPGNRASAYVAPCPGVPILGKTRQFRRKINSLHFCHFSSYSLHTAFPFLYHILALWFLL